jgi:regulator of sigma E protease
MTILSFLACIGPLIFVHELGHYLVGRWCGVKADVFSIGFGREVAGWTDRRGTRWKVGWLPLGGYVKFKGDMNPASQPSDEWLALPAEERAQTFQARPLWQRALIVAAGPLINFLLAILLFMGIFAAIGYPTAPPIVTALVTGGPAASAGVMPGDRLVSVNGREVSNFAQVKDYVMLRPAQSLDVVVEREGRRFSFPATTGSTVMKDSFGNEAKIGTLGVYSNAVAFEKLPLSQLPGRAVIQTSDTVQAMVLTLGQLIMGQRSVKELGGPLKIAQVSGQQASLGWLPFFWLMAVISINLGFINLLPIPLLDGGHLLFYGIEAVRRKPLRPEAQEWAFRTGLAALLALMVFVTFNDLSSFGVWKHLGG